MPGQRNRRRKVIVEMVTVGVITKAVYDVSNLYGDYQLKSLKKLDLIEKQGYHESVREVTPFHL